MKFEKSIMDIHEVAKFLNLGERTVYNMSRKGEIPCRKIAKQWRYNRDTIISWVDGDGKPARDKRKPAKGDAPEKKQLIDMIELLKKAVEGM